MGGTGVSPVGVEALGATWRARCTSQLRTLRWAPGFLLLFFFFFFLLMQGRASQLCRQEWMLTCLRNTENVPPNKRNPGGRENGIFKGFIKEVCEMDVSPFSTDEFERCQNCDFFGMQ